MASRHGLLVAVVVLCVSAAMAEPKKNVLFIAVDVSNCCSSTCVQTRTCSTILFSSEQCMCALKHVATSDSIQRRLAVDQNDCLIVRDLQPTSLFFSSTTHSMITEWSRHVCANHWSPICVHLLWDSLPVRVPHR